MLLKTSKVLWTLKNIRLPKFDIYQGIAVNVSQNFKFDTTELDTTQWTKTQSLIQSVLSSLQYGTCFLHFLSSHLFIQPPLKPLPKIPSSMSVFFYLSIPSPFFLQNQHSKLYQHSLPLHISHLGNSGCFTSPIRRNFRENWHCFNLSLLHRHANSAHNYWFLIAESQKVSVSQ